MANATDPSDEQPSRPPSRSGSFPSLGYLYTPFEKWREDNFEWSSAITLLDTFETFFDSRFDLWERRLKKQGKMVVNGTRDAIRKRRLDSNIDREITRYKEKARFFLFYLFYFGPWNVSYARKG